MSNNSLYDYMMKEYDKLQTKSMSISRRYMGGLLSHNSYTEQRIECNSKMEVIKKAIDYYLCQDH